MGKEIYLSTQEMEYIVRLDAITDPDDLDVDVISDLASKCKKGLKASRWKRVKK